MNKLIIICAALSGLAFLGCDGPKTKDHGQTNMQNEKDAGSPATMELSYMKLDGEEKWRANFETTAGIENMMEIIEDRSDDINTDTLKKSLQAEMNIIFQKCTMTGEAHEQLHNYLIPLKDQIATLGDENQESSVKDISSYLSKYWSYFQ